MRSEIIEPITNPIFFESCLFFLFRGGNRPREGRDCKFGQPSDLTTIQAAKIWGKSFLAGRLFILDLDAFLININVIPNDSFQVPCMHSLGYYSYKKTFFRLR